MVMMVPTESIAHSPMFANLPAEKLQVFAALAEETTCAKDSTLFEEGDSADKLYILVEGKVLIKVHLAARSEQVCIAVLNHPGQLIGWSGFMTASRYTATASCSEDTRLIALDGGAFVKALEADPITGFAVMRHIGEVISGRLRNIQRLVLKTL
jgi:CRP-like cAMP-binding protein